MKLTNIEQVNSFLKAVDECRGDVWLTSPEGDKINLKSQLSQYVAVGRLLEEKGDWFELFCSDENDERIMVDFLYDNPEII